MLLRIIAIEVMRLMSVFKHVTIYRLRASPRIQRQHGKCQTADMAKLFHIGAPAYVFFKIAAISTAISPLPHAIRLFRLMLRHAAQTFIHSIASMPVSYRRRRRSVFATMLSCFSRERYGDDRFMPRDGLPNDYFA